jgi:hypothetical protein
MNRTRPPTYVNAPLPSVARLHRRSALTPSGRTLILAPVGPYRFIQRVPLGNNAEVGGGLSPRLFGMPDPHV